MCIRDRVYRIQVSPDNCVGCGLCVTECPGKGGKKALTMVPVKEELEHAPLADYMYSKVSYKADRYPTTTVKGVGSVSYTHLHFFIK